MKLSIFLAVLPVALATPVAIARSAGGEAEAACWFAYASQPFLTTRKVVKENLLTF